MHDVSYQLWFAVRFVHVASVALLVGGALLLAVSYFLPRIPSGSEIASTGALIYEWTFWTLIGVVAVTGVSNLGLKGEGLLGPATSWGRALTMKLGAVAVLLAVSLLRSDFVIRCDMASGEAWSSRARTIAGSLYAATVAMMLGAVWLGLGLAHGRY